MTEPTIRSVIHQLYSLSREVAWHGSRQRRVGTAIAASERAAALIISEALDAVAYHLDSSPHEFLEGKFIDVTEVFNGVL